jgi:CheY-like chemotaxis protein
LATCYAIVKQHLGFIVLYTEVGRGTVFKVYLPEHAKTGAASAGQAASHSLPGGNETILLCEDDPSVRRVTSKLMTAAGYRVLVADNGTAALDLAAAHSGPIDLLVTDLVMPGMNGQRLSELLTQARPATRVLCVSGYTANMLAQGLQLDGARALLVKPYTRSSLLTAIREVLSGGVSTAPH